MLKATEERFPAVGEISFFLGIPQVYTFTGKPSKSVPGGLPLCLLGEMMTNSVPSIFAATTKSEVKLLTLSKEDYEEVKDRFPDARDILINNVRNLVGIGKDGEFRVGSYSLQGDAYEATRDSRRGLMPVVVSPGEELDFQILDATHNKDSNALSLRKRVHEALRTKLDDEVAVGAIPVER